MHYDKITQKTHHKHKRIYAQWMGPVRQNTKNPENCKNCSSKCAYDCAQLQYTIQHRTVLIISPLTIIGHIGDRFLQIEWPNQQCQSTEGRCSSLQTIIIAQMLSIGGEHGTQLTVVRITTWMLLHGSTSMLSSPINKLYLLLILESLPKYWRSTTANDNTYQYKYRTNK